LNDSLYMMSANSSWAEVRWREPHPTPSAHDPTMATRTLLAESRTSVSDDHEGQRARVLEPYRRIDHEIHSSIPSLHLRGPTAQSHDKRLLSESRYFPEHMASPYGPQHASISTLGNFDGVRTGSMSVYSRRTSELQPTSDARVSNGA
jgi:hypothetical protein